MSLNGMKTTSELSLEVKFSDLIGQRLGKQLSPRHLSANYRHQNQFLLTALHLAVSILLLKLGILKARLPSHIKK